ncbi:H3 protein, partial [Caloenas nicobarica]|nr:H3 protein [Caloenas nicobarica]
CPHLPGLWKKLRRLQKKPLKLLPAAFCRGLVQLFSDTWKGFQVHGAAVVALREACEVHLLALLEEWRLCALHAKRSTVQTSDVNLVRCLQVKRD